MFYIVHLKLHNVVSFLVCCEWYTLAHHMIVRFFMQVTKPIH